MKKIMLRFIRNKNWPNTLWQWLHQMSFEKWKFSSCCWERIEDLPLASYLFFVRKATQCQFESMNFPISLLKKQSAPILIVIHFWLYYICLPICIFEEENTSWIGNFLIDIIEDNWKEILCILVDYGTVKLVEIKFWCMKKMCPTSSYSRIS